MTREASLLSGSIAFFVTPATFEPGSTVFKTKEKAKTWIPD